MKTYLELTKSGIITFVILTGLAGYAVSFPVGHQIDWPEIFSFLFGLYLVTAGSFSLNQFQEYNRDEKMKRTSSRPIPTGKVAPWQALALALLFIPVGGLVLYAVEPMAAFVSLSTVVLYNGLYTLYWKTNWAFGAVPGAIPGALPVVIGYAVNKPNQLLAPDCIYLFLIMFLWQMPHFWCLAIRYKDDYVNGGFPVLPSVVGVPKTMYHIGLYVLVYSGLALMSPLFTHASVVYIFLVFPLAIKVVWEFYKFYNSEGQQKWLPFFLWTNLSMLIFTAAPVFDKWVFYNTNL